MTEKSYSKIIDILCNFFNSKNRKKRNIFRGWLFFERQKENKKRGIVFRNPYKRI